MRKLLLAFLAVTAGFLPLAAQDWAPFKMGRTPYFQAGDSVYSLRVTNAFTQGSDSVFEFNPRVVRFAGNVATTSGNNFFGQRMLKKSTGEYLFVFEPADTFRLMPATAPGISWQFSATPLLTATLQSTSVAPVAGQPDSVKTILLSNGQEIVLSKNHGIVESRSFLSYLNLQGNSDAWQLKRMPESGIGKPLADIFTIFDFQPGDKFLYSDNMNAYGGPCRNIKTTLEIISRTNITGSNQVVYEIARQNLTTFLGNPQSPPPCHGSVHQELSPVSTYQLVLDNGSNFTFLNKLLNPGHFSFLSWEHRLLGSSGPFSPKYNSGQFVSSFNNRWAMQLTSATYDSATGHYSSWADVEEESYAEGLGLVNEKLQALDYDYEINFIAYIKGTETYGNWQPLVLSAEEELARTPIQVYPNPFSDELTIQLPQPDVAADIIIYNLQGQKIRVLQAKNGAKLHLTELPAGLYFLHVRQGERSYTSKVQKE